MKKNAEITGDETINIFIPLEIKKRGGTAMVVMPKNANADDSQKYFDEKMIKSIARAHKWKIMLDEGQVVSLAQIAEKENVGSSYVSRIFNLNFLSPKIVERILNGTQPRTLKLQDIVIKEMPDLWQEQEERWGF
jgi:hypothetical protein